MTLTGDPCITSSLHLPLRQLLITSNRAQACLAYRSGYTGGSGEELAVIVTSGGILIEIPSALQHET